MKISKRTHVPDDYQPASKRGMQVRIAGHGEKTCMPISLHEWSLLY